MPAFGITIWSRRLEQGDGILFDTRLAPRTGTWRFARSAAKRVLKYIRKQGARAMASRRRNGRHASCRRRHRSAGAGRRYGRHQSRRFKRRRTRLIDRLPQKEQPALFERRAIRASYFPASDVPVAGLVDLNERAIPNPISTFFGKVRGISPDRRRHRGQRFGDRGPDARTPVGRFAVCVTSEGFAMKYVEVRRREIWLMPGNKDYAPIRLPARTNG